jgi:hypothetical protein
MSSLLYQLSYGLSRRRLIKKKRLPRLIYPTSKTYTIQLFHFSLNNKSIKKGLLRRRFYIIKNIHSPGREVSIYMAALRIDGYSFISPLWGFPPKTSIALHLLVVNLAKCFSDNLRPLRKEQSSCSTNNSIYCGRSMQLNQMFSQFRIVFIISV